jgi:hypothetical protein
MRRTCMIFSLAATVALGTACGSEKKQEEDGRKGASTVGMGGMTVVDDAALPACEASLEGHFVYVSSTKTFKACAEGAWTVIDVTGAAGEKGADGAKGEKGDAGGEIAEAIKLFQSYRRGILRVTLECTKTTTAGACSNNTNYPATVGFNGSAFVCGENKVCTNRHVTDCNDDNACYAGAGGSSLSFQAPDPDNDSVGDGTASGIAPFFTTADNDGVEFHATKDLSVVTVTDLPEGTPILPLATESSITNLQSILSLSYPLGMHDIYVDVGNVNVADMDDCIYGGSCPSSFYDFSTTNDTDHGSSGSPLIDVATGKVVGVTSAGTEGENANYTWAIDATNFEGL